MTLKKAIDRVVMMYKFELMPMAVMSPEEVIVTSESLPCFFPMLAFSFLLFFFVG